MTQVTSEAVLGIPGRRYREWVLASHIPHRRLGQLVVVPLDVALAALRPLQAESEPVDELDALRARAGLRRVG